MIKKRQRVKFHVPNFGAPNRKRVKDRWRSQRGIDNKRRVKKLNRGPTPSIGYKNSDAVRYMRPDGRREMLVHNEKELMLLAGKKDVCAVLAHDLSSRKKISMQKAADEKSIKVANRVKL